MFSLNSCAQSEVPQNIIPEKYELDRIEKLYQKYSKKAVDLTTLLPNGFSKKGDTDYTQELQRGLDKYNTILMPNFPVLINDIGLTISGNTVVLFQPNSKIILKASAKETYEVLRIHQVKNVKIFNANILADAEKHLGDKGEWGMGIAIRSSANVEIFNANIKNCWGDGIYIGQIWNRSESRTTLEKESENIEIYNTVCNHNRRNGLSIVAGINVKIYHSVFANSYDTFPKSGIDIEPGPGKTNNIEVVNCVTYNNKARGIDLMLRKLPKLGDNHINLTISDHLDELSPIGIRIAGYKDLMPSEKYRVISGKIVIDNPVLRKNRINGIDFEINQRLAPYIQICNPKITNILGDKIKISAQVNLNKIEKNNIIEIE